MRVRPSAQLQQRVERLAPERVQRGGGEGVPFGKLRAETANKERRAARLFQILFRGGFVQRAMDRRFRRVAGRLDFICAVGNDEPRRLRVHLKRQIDRNERRFGSIERGKRLEHVRRVRHVLLGAVAKHVRAALAGEVAVRKPAAGKHRAEGFRVVGFPSERLTAGGRRGGDVFRPLHAAFDLK
ncbi:hypothetical protein SDC9_168560 [bioreactor metagenome]|uniref:Uncharacterized protein n=1 Tax=bioreactor metagenome TaxID=1076179 RepID=A0A645G2W0_9ZZZZ